MTLIENISLIQRILSSVKEDVESLGASGTSIKAKMEILEGELGIFRSLWEETPETQETETQNLAMDNFTNVDNNDIIDVE